MATGEQECLKCIESYRKGLEDDAKRESTPCTWRGQAPASNPITMLVDNNN